MARLKKVPRVEENIEVVNNPFSFKGRSGRLNFLLAGVLPFFIMFVIGQAGRRGVDSDTIIGLFLISLPFLYMLLAAIARRARDIGTSPWIGIFMFIPVIGLLVLIYLLFASKKS